MKILPDCSFFNLLENRQTITNFSIDKMYINYFVKILNMCASSPSFLKSFFSFSWKCPVANIYMLLRLSNIWNFENISQDKSYGTHRMCLWETLKFRRCTCWRRFDFKDTFTANATFVVICTLSFMQYNHRTKSRRHFHDLMKVKEKSNKNGVFKTKIECFAIYAHAMTRKRTLRYNIDSLDACRVFHHPEKWSYDCIKYVDLIPKVRIKTIKNGIFKERLEMSWIYARANARAQE